MNKNRLAVRRFFVHYQTETAHTLFARTTTRLYFYCAGEAYSNPRIP